MLSAGLSGDDPLEAFIASGHSGRGDLGLGLGDGHVMRARSGAGPVGRVGPPPWHDTEVASP